MFLTVHATVGALIGQSVPNPWIAFVLGFISHFFVDFIPHGDQNLINGATQRERIKKLLGITAIDLALLALVALYFATNKTFAYPLSVAAGAFGAMLPDGLQGITIFTNGKILSRYTRFHGLFHISTHARFAHIVLPFTVGLPLQIFFWFIVQRAIGI